MQNSQGGADNSDEQMLAMLMAALGGNSDTAQGTPNERYIKQADISTTMEELNCKWNYAVAIENGLLESRVLEQQSGKPAFNKEQLLSAIKEMGNCDPEIAARTLRIMQHASIGPDEINIDQVPQTMEDIGCNPEEAVSVMHHLKGWEHTPNRPLSDIGILHRMFQNPDLRYAFNIFKAIEDHEAARLSEEDWEDMSADVARDIYALQAHVILETGDTKKSSVLMEQADVESGKNMLEEVIASLDAIKEGQRKETERAQSARTKKTTPDISKMAKSPKKKPTAKKKKKDEGGLYSSSRGGFLLGDEKPKNTTAARQKQKVFSKKKPGKKR